MKKYLKLLKNSDKGFTLMELIVVIAILGILLGTIVFTLNPIDQIRKGRDSQRKNDLAQIQRGLEQYYSDNGRYPTSDAGNQINDAPSCGGAACVWGNRWGTSGTIYMAKLPKDPISSKKYIYVEGANQQSYSLYANLERGKNDLQICFPATGAKCTNAPAATCGTATDLCNYGVSSSNTSP